ncbi:MULTISPECIES: hypothetical protein [Nocardioides]|uniref:Uncharacterized protein n=1 Tax=Nocardioides vastitatis TaxID=2568655 RepID=A0ABW0ZJN9_9ACTN|nr:hypothetical protein [Nocardioides sp.]THJ04658.1 hypothetical protein E7Z54_08115 [Nocardioides sp.]
MDALTYAWTVSLLVTACTLPIGIIRTLAYRSGQIDHTPTMRTVAIFAMSLGLLGLLCFAALSAAMLLR